MNISDRQLEWVLEEFLINAFPGVSPYGEIFGYVILKDTPEQNQQNEENIKKVKNFAGNGLSQALEEVNEIIEEGERFVGNSRLSRAEQIVEFYKSKTEVIDDVLEKVFKISVEKIELSASAPDIYYHLISSDYKLHQVYYFYYIFDLNDKYSDRGAILPLSKCIESYMSTGSAEDYYIEVEV